MSAGAAEPSSSVCPNVWRPEPTRTASARPCTKRSGLSSACDDSQPTTAPRDRCPIAPLREQRSLAEAGCGLHDDRPAAAELRAVGAQGAAAPAGPLGARGGVIFGIQSRLGDGGARRSSGGQAESPVLGPVVRQQAHECKISTGESEFNRSVSSTTVRATAGPSVFAITRHATPVSWSVRACSIAFCSAHQAADNVGSRGPHRVHGGQASASEQISLAQHFTADFLVCSQCGVSSAP